MGERRVLRSARLQHQDKISDLDFVQRTKVSELTNSLEIKEFIPPIESNERRYIPCRERSLHSTINSRSLRARRGAGRQAGYNHGRHVIYRD